MAYSSPNVVTGQNIYSSKLRYDDGDDDGDDDDDDDDGGDDDDDDDDDDDGNDDDEEALIIKVKDLKGPKERKCTNKVSQRASRMVLDEGQARTICLAPSCFAIRASNR